MFVIKEIVQKGKRRLPEAKFTSAKNCIESLDMNLLLTS